MTAYCSGDQENQEEDFGPGDMPQWGECLPTLYEALTSIPCSTYARRSDAHLQSHHLGGGNRNNRSSKSFRVIYNKFTVSQAI